MIRIYHVYFTKEVIGVDLNRSAHFDLHALGLAAKFCTQGNLGLSIGWAKVCKILNFK